MLAGCGTLMQCFHSITTDITSASSRQPFIFQGVNEEVVTAVVPHSAEVHSAEVHSAEVHSAEVRARSHGERKSGPSLASEIRWRDCHVIHRVRASQAAILYSSPCLTQESLMGTSRI
jgi:hypothetical protein